VDPTIAERLAREVPYFKLMYVNRLLCTFIFWFTVVFPSIARQIVTPKSQSGDISRTVTGVNDGIVPGAKVVLEGSLVAQRRTMTAKDDGSFNFSGPASGVPYHISVSADGLVDWTSPTLILIPGQFLSLTDIKLRLSVGLTSVDRIASSIGVAGNVSHYSASCRSWCRSRRHLAASLTDASLQI
jgi:hypothetical protein